MENLAHETRAWNHRLDLYRLQPVDVRSNDDALFMSPHNIRLEWLSAGGSPHLADTMTAIALAESHGRITAWNHKDPYGGSYGLWQINGVHPFSAHRLHHDPFYNAQAAVYVLKHQGLNAWSTHADGTYLRYLHEIPFTPYKHMHHAHRTMHHHQLAQTAPVEYSTAGAGLFGFVLIWYMLLAKLKESIQRERVRT
jgi:hypothetical protein